MVSNHSETPLFQTAAALCSDALRPRSNKLDDIATKNLRKQEDQSEAALKLLLQNPIITCFTHVTLKRHKQEARQARICNVSYPVRVHHP
jgi:hypothetical protein